MNSISSVIPITSAYQSGHQTLLLSGRSLSDLDISVEGDLKTLQENLTTELWNTFGMASLRCNLALGPKWDWENVDEGSKSEYESLFSERKLPLSTGIEIARNHNQSSYERSYLLLASLYRTLEISDSIPPLCVIWEFGEDLAPDPTHGGSSEWVTMICQIFQKISNDMMGQNHPFLMILNGEPDHVDPRIVESLHHLHLGQPDQNDKLKFIAKLESDPNFERASLSGELDRRSLANLTAKTPNSSLRKIYRASHLTGEPIALREIIAQKKNDVIELSDGTLSLLDTERVENLKLVGKTVERPLQLLEKWATGLKSGNRFTPMNVILAGAPSTAKTDLALLTAALSGTPAYSILSPKGSLVGETEAKVRLLFRVFKEQSPAFGVIDEVTEAFPTERGGQNLDSGATASVTAEMLTALSDSSRAGKSLLIATTNCPWKVGAAMASRFLYLPVLSAIREDYPAILCAVSSSLLPELSWDANDPTIIDAASVFYDKGATPRVMRTLISSKIVTLSDTPSVSLVLRAAKTCAQQDPRDRISGIYADLFAIRACSDLEMLPWYGRMTEYPLPEYLREIVDSNSGEIDTERLNRELESLKPHVNV